MLCGRWPGLASLIRVQFNRGLEKSCKDLEKSSESLGTASAKALRQECPWRAFEASWWLPPKQWGGEWEVSSQRWTGLLSLVGARGELSR